MKKSIKKWSVVLLVVVLCIASCISTFASGTEKTVMEFLDDYQKLINVLGESDVSSRTIDSEQKSYMYFQRDIWDTYQALGTHLDTLDANLGLVGFSGLNSRNINY